MSDLQGLDLTAVHRDAAVLDQIGSGQLPDSPDELSLILHQWREEIYAAPVLSHDLVEGVLRNRQRVPERWWRRLWTWVRRW